VATANPIIDLGVEGRRLRRGLAPAVALGGLAGGLVVVQTFLLSGVIDAVFLRAAGLREVAPALVGLAAVALGKAAASWGQEVAAQRVSAAVRLDVRDRLVRRLLALGPRYTTGERTGELTNALVGGVESLDAYLAQYLPQAYLAGIVPFLILLAVLRADPLSALVLALTFPLIPLFMGLIGSMAQTKTRRQWVTLSRLSARFLDALQGLATLKAFGRAGEAADGIAEASDLYRRVTMGVLRLAFLSALVLELLAMLGTAIVAVEVGLRLLYARVAFREALFVLVLTPEFYRPLRALGAAFHAGMAGREAAGRLSEVLETPGPFAAPGVLTRPETAAVTPAGEVPGGGRPAVASPSPGLGRETHRRDHEAGVGVSVTARSESPPAPKVPSGLEPAIAEPTAGLETRAVGTGPSRPPAIRLQDVRYAYASGRPAALAGLTLSLPAGETVALVGPTGAGKTTVALLLLRFLEPSGGAILVDGRPLSDLAPEEWRRRVAWVPQRPWLFHGTLLENLLLARPDAPRAAVEEALALAHADALVRELPRGWDTPLGEGGERLSGGEAQRIALARAFLKDAPVLVLDEPTAQLDPAGEAAVVDSMARLRRGRTVLLIAHRLTTVFDVDGIALVDRGRLVEEGRHAELLARGRLYPRLVAAWGGTA
jgi:ABC-type transport system involved in cytochrome bd biosynthesis fused ATPase/permease subunit